ncbi:MAG: gamma-glutamyl-gamma-aminobutyrate hydrolase family protein [Chloroflexota bacterium]|nr:gamma-glutamyl-gamma-aminobutyrate hydrolase family protein [Chloroflexota bacterium]
MICYVDMEHQKALPGAEKRAVHQAYCTDVRLRLEEICGDACLVRNYKCITQQWLWESEVKALIISGNTTEWAEYDEADLLKMSRIIRNAELPILGVCGGCQLIAMAHGSSLGPIRRLEEGEEDPCEGYAPGYVKEWGFVPVHILKSDPLFDGLGEEPRFLAAHYWEVKTIPPGFELLAFSDDCRIQAIKRIGKPVYGTQFHPEAYTEGHVGHRSWLIDLVYPGGYTEKQADGHRLLANFFLASGVLE